MPAVKPYRKRLLREYKAMKLTPPPHIVAAPLASNLLEWHYCVYGLKDCPYEGGFYHGKLIFPEQYPFKPPGIMMLTPSGRFQPATRLCMSMSDYHPDQWNPAWCVESILKGLVSFMLEGTATAGSITTTAAEKERLALESGAHNLKNAIFCELFPEMVDMITAEHERRKNAAAAGKPEVSKAASGQDAEQDPNEGGASTGANIALAMAVVLFAYVASVIMGDVK